MLLSLNLYKQECSCLRSVITSCDQLDAVWLQEGLLAAGTSAVVTAGTSDDRSRRVLRELQARVEVVNFAQVRWQGGTLATWLLPVGRTEYEAYAPPWESRTRAMTRQ
jgi:hypothetical protein